LGLVNRPVNGEWLTRQSVLVRQKLSVQFFLVKIALVRTEKFASGRTPELESFQTWKFWVAVISAKNHKRQRRKRQSVTAKREKSQTPKL